MRVEITRGELVLADGYRLPVAGVTVRCDRTGLVVEDSEGSTLFHLCNHRRTVQAVETMHTDAGPQPRYTARCSDCPAFAASKAGPPPLDPLWLLDWGLSV